jgi:hypothetical protein
VDCCNLWAHLRVGCMYAIVSIEIPVVASGCYPIDYHFTPFLVCVNRIPSMVIVSVLKPD